MMRALRRSLRSVAAASIAALGGCLGGAIEPDAAATRIAPSSLDWSDWGLTLSRAVQGELVDYSAVMADPAPLNRCLAMVGRIGPRRTPEQFPDDAGRLAYYINCYNATVMRSVIALAVDGKPPARAPWGLENRFRFRIDDRWQSPADLRQTALELAGDDWRARFALCDGRRGSPPLWRRPFLADLLDGQLGHVTREFLCAPQIVSIEHGERKRLLLWRDLFAIKDRLVAEYERRLHTTDATVVNALGLWSNRSRRLTLNSAIGYEVAALSFDDRINQIDPPPEESAGLLSGFK